MMKKYFIRPDGYVDSECFVDNPANPAHFAIVETDTISGHPAGWTYSNGMFSPPVKTPQQLRAEARAARTVAVAAITVTTSTGKVFDGDEISQTRMARAIIGLQAAGVPTITWTLANNSITAVTLAELTEALILAGQRQAELWPIPE